MPNGTGGLDNITSIFDFVVNHLFLPTWRKITPFVSDHCKRAGRKDQSKSFLKGYKYIGRNKKDLRIDEPRHSYFSQNVFRKNKGKRGIIKK